MGWDGTQRYRFHFPTPSTKLANNNNDVCHQKQSPICNTWMTFRLITFPSHLAELMRDKYISFCVFVVNHLSQPKIRNSKSSHNHHYISSWLGNWHLWPPIKKSFYCFCPHRLLSHLTCCFLHFHYWKLKCNWVEWEGRRRRWWARVTRSDLWLTGWLTPLHYKMRQV